MPIASPETYSQMLDRAKVGKFAYPAINVSSSSTLIAALRGFAEANSDGIIQFSWGGAEFASGSTVKKMVDGERIQWYVPGCIEPGTPEWTTQFTSVCE